MSGFKFGHSMFGPPGPPFAKPAIPFGQTDTNDAKPFSTPPPPDYGPRTYKYPIPTSLARGDNVIYHNVIGYQHITESMRIGGQIGADKATNFPGVYWLVPPEKDLYLKNATIYAVKENLVKPKYSVGTKMRVDIAECKITQTAEIAKVQLCEGKIMYTYLFKDGWWRMSEDELE